MRTGNWRWMGTAAALALAAVMLPTAEAQCGRPLKQVKPMSWQPQYNGAAARATRFDGPAEASIVGMWHVTFTAKTLNGAPIKDMVIDSALVVWHSDGTEIMNSGRPPQDGNFCLGVWESTGRSSYRLNHFAWGANDYEPGTPPGQVGQPIAGVHYTENVTLAHDGRSYSGMFTLDQYSTTGQVGPSFTGEVQATRITVNTKGSELF